MAIDVYLQIDGIKGESQDDKHKDWIECASVNWGLIQPRSATASTGGGHTAERVEIQEITFSKMADLSSPILMQTCAMGKTIPKAKFELMRADGNGVPIKYFEIEFRERPHRRDFAWNRSRVDFGRTCQPEILQGQMEIHSAKDWRRHWRLDSWRLGFGGQ